MAAPKTFPEYFQSPNANAGVQRHRHTAMHSKEMHPKEMPPDRSGGTLSATADIRPSSQP
jgi:hypothetical protein